MPTSLSSIRRKLLVRVLYLDKAFDRYVVCRKEKNRIDRFAVQEGFVSVLWQCWSTFCREIIICSVKGAYTFNGEITTSPYSIYSELEVAFVAKQLSHNRNIGQVKALSGSYLEPTWGDLDKLLLVTQGIQCSNCSDLVSAFASCVRVKDLHLCRNASAHLSSDMIEKVRKARVRYQDTKFSHPSDIILWVDPDTGGFLWKSWVGELDLMSGIAIGKMQPT